MRNTLRMNFKPEKFSKSLISTQFYCNITSPVREAYCKNEKNIVNHMPVTSK